MSAHERLEREMAIAEGRAWLVARPNAIALCSALAQVGHVPTCAAAMLAPVMDAGHALWARIVREVTADQPSTVLVEMFGPALEAGKAYSEEIGWDDDTDDIPF